jgi:hypothetical protein
MGTKMVSQYQTWCPHLPSERGLQPASPYQPPLAMEREESHAPRIIALSAALMLAALFLVSCRTTPLPPANFSAPGWRVLQGQAVWKPDRKRPELTGDLLLATNVNGNFFVQFTKNPFPLMTAQVSGGRWQIESGADGRAWRGHGTGPNRVGWFQLPRALAGGKLADGWQFERPTPDSWRLENPRTGETLEGEFFQ